MLGAGNTNNNNGYVSPRVGRIFDKKWTSPRKKVTTTKETSPANIEEKPENIHKYVYYC